MRLLLSVVLFASLTLIVRADSATGPLQVNVSSDWSVKYDGDKGVQFYTLTRPQGENVVLMFSRWPAPGNADQMPGFLDQMATTFIAKAKTNSKIKLDSPTYTKGEFLGNPYSGNYVQFTIKGGMKMVMFMFSDGDGIWNGQYIGSADGWNEAMDVLKGIKKS